ncbi:hypothetical protein [Myxococcus xanthus]|uniref:Integrase n=1 Tax=Myxococcus xanthus TaxID=34 RepID=A0AAE6G575_MYXXA|nr:hypothetical protein [Myxococcus xanthus]QDE71162.1 hypothetical protein BHS09_31640 [Myxococcus xanthus]QDE78442.1 hypothetical protein BHS08_31660 [Myxococcus xanthus]QDE85819.1 hypothetical protein BHS07_32215 [Myxococcus xanthus]QDF07742.1 hypothetical protein BHS04_31760 [Myxococcus xanthus]
MRSWWTRRPKTVNNVLVALNTVFKTALKWGVIEQMPATVELLKGPFYEPHEDERLVKVTAKVAGHQNLSTPQRYMHLSPAAKSAATRMLAGPRQEAQNETGWRPCDLQPAS